MKEGEFIVPLKYFTLRTANYKITVLNVVNVTLNRIWPNRN